MWGMTAMKKGTAMKDKKKRAGGGGAPSFGPFRIAPFSTITTSTAQSGWSHSGLDIKVIDISTIPETIVTDATTGFSLGGGGPFPINPFTLVPLDDVAATVAATSPASRIHQTGGLAQVASMDIPAGFDYMIDIEASVSPSNQHSSIRQVDYFLDVIHDPSGLFAAKTVVFNSPGVPPLQDSVRSNMHSGTFRLAEGGPFQMIVSAGTRSGDSLILELTATITDNSGSHTTMTTETLTNLLNGTASIKDSMYYAFNFL